MKISASRIYEYFYRSKFNATHGRLPKRISNFNKIRINKKHWWDECEKLVQLVTRNNGIIDPFVLIDAVVNEYGTNAEYKDLCTRKSLNIYKDYIKRNELYSIADDALMYNKFKKSVNFVVEYCADNSITFEEYLNKNIIGYPDLLRHYNAGSVCIHFLAAIPGIIFIFENYQVDILNDFTDYNKLKFELVQARHRIRYNKKFDSWNDIYLIMQKLIEKKHEKRSIASN